MDTNTIIPAELAATIFFILGGGIIQSVSRCFPAQISIMESWGPKANR